MFPARSIGLVLLVVCLCLFVPSRTSLADTQRTSSNPASFSPLVKRLGASSFQVRLQAEADCRETGSAVIPALIEALKSPDPELRRRAQMLIEQIEDDELTASIDLFLEPGSLSTLPGWPIVSDLVDDTSASRSAYAQMLRGNTQLARALTHPHLIASELQRTLQNLGSTHGINTQGISTERTMVILLLLIHPDATYSADWGEIASRLIRPGAIQGVNESASGQLLRALVTRWVTTPHAGLSLDRLDTALRLALPESVIPAQEMLQQKTSPHQLNNAFVAMIRYGDAAEMAMVETLLDDKFELNAQRGPGDVLTSSTQIRDLALATLIEMTHQDPTIYGMKPFPRDANKKVTTLPVSFENEAQRQAAFEKWSEWSGAHLPKYCPLPAQAEEGIGL